MKTLHLIFSILLVAGVAAAQASRNPSEPPDLMVLEKTWHTEFRYPDNNQNPLKPNEDYQDLVRAQKRAIVRNDQRPVNQTTEEAMPGPMPTVVASPWEGLKSYVYKAKVKNNGGKTIGAISWEYVFIDPDTGEEMGHHKATSSVKIRPSQSRELIARFASKPTHIINVGRVGEKLKTQFTERVVIHRIDYTDGSVWKRLPGQDEH